MVHVELTWPEGVDSPRHLAAFDLSIEQAFAMFLDGKIVGGSPDPSTPTPRLRRAIAEADKILETRFATADDLFDALSAKR